MGPGDIYFLVTALIRVGTAASQAYEQKLRDSAQALPGVGHSGSTIAQAFSSYFDNDGAWLVDETTGPLREHWKVYRNRPAGPNPPTEAESRALLWQAFDRGRQLAISSQGGVAWLEHCMAAEPGGLLLVQQWSAKGAPLSPWVRVAVALADVGLGYAKAKPELFGVGANGEKFLASLCENLQLLLPDPNVANNAPQFGFVERMAVITLQAGLKTVTDHPELVANKAHYQSLTLAIAKPLADRYQQAIADNDVFGWLRWERVRDQLYPEIVRAAAGALAAEPDAFLTDIGIGDNGVAVLTGTFLDMVAKSGDGPLGLKNATFWVGAYRAVLGVAAKRPELFVGGLSANDQILRLVLKSSLEAFAAPPHEISKDWLPELAATVLQSVGEGLSPWRADPWHLVADAAVKQILAGLAGGLRQKKLPRQIGRDSFLMLVRVVVEQAAKTPGMLTNKEGPAELQTIVAAIAAAMAADANLLLRGEDWVRIAAVAAAEAASDPAGLFRLDVGVPEQQLAARLIEILLRNAADSLANAPRSQGGALLFGQTLVEAIEHTLRVASGNAKRAAANIAALRQLVEALNRLALAQAVSANANEPPPPGIGATEWLWLFRKLLTGALDTGKVETDPANLRKLLYAGGDT